NYTPNLELLRLAWHPFQADPWGRLGLTSSGDVEAQAKRRDQAASGTPRGTLPLLGSTHHCAAAMWELTSLGSRKIPPPVEGDAERIPLGAQTIPGMELDPTDAPRPLDAPPCQARLWDPQQHGAPPIPREVAGQVNRSGHRLRSVRDGISPRLG